MLFCRCPRHHRLEREMQGGTRERFGHTRVLDGAHDQEVALGRAASDLAPPRGRVCCDPGGSGTRCGVRRRNEPHCRSHSAATKEAEIVELSVSSAGAASQVPSSPSPWTQRYNVQGEMSSVRMPCSGAVDTIIANLKMWCTAGVLVVNMLFCQCRRHHRLEREMRGGTRERFGQTRVLDGAHDQEDALGGLRQTWPRRGDEYVEACVYGSKTSVRMFHGRDPRVRYPSGFSGDLQSYVSHPQQSFKEIRDARGAPLQRHEGAR